MVLSIHFCPEFRFVMTDPVYFTQFTFLMEALFLWCGKNKAEPMDFDIRSYICIYLHSVSGATKTSDPVFCALMKV